MATRRVTVKDRRAKYSYYEISEYSGTFSVYQGSSGFFSSQRKVGTANKLADALDLIKADSRGEKLEINGYPSVK